MTSLEAFGFGSPVTPMPRGVFDALAQLTTLEILHLDLSTHRDNVHDCEFLEWSCTDQIASADGAYMITLSAVLGTLAPTGGALAYLWSLQLPSPAIRRDRGAV